MAVPLAAAPPARPPRPHLAPASGDARPELPALAQAALLTALFWLAARAFGTPLYHTFDDPLLQLTVNGQGAVAYPDRHLLFSNVLLGGALVALRRWTGAEVYGAHVLGASWLGILVGAYALLRLTQRAVERAAVAAVLALFVPFLAARPQFTTSAGVLGAAALGLAASLLLRPPRGRGAAFGAWALVVGTAVYGVLTRPAGALSAGVGVGPLLLWAFWRARGPRRWALAAVAVFALAFVGARAADGAAYRGPEWARYFDAEQYRAMVVDYPRVTGTPDQAAAYALGGLTVNDVALVRTNFFLPPVPFTAARAERVFAAVPAWRGGGAAAAEVVAMARTLLTDPHVAPATLAVLVTLGALAAYRPTRRVAVVAAAGAALAVLVFASVSVLGRGGYARVFVPGLTALALVQMAVLLAVRPDRTRGERAGRRLWPALAAGTGLVALAQAAFYVRNASKADRFVAEAAADVARLAPRPDELYVIWDVALPAARLVRPGGTDPHFAAGHWYWLGTATLAPYSLAQLRAFPAPDLPTALADRRDVHLVAQPFQVARLVALYREHYGRAVAPCERFRGATFTVYDVRPAAAAPAPGAPVPACAPGA